MTALQPSLFGEVPPPHVRGSRPSATAADKLDPKALQQQVLDAITAAPRGLTDSDLYRLFPHKREGTVRARRVRLRDLDLVRADGERSGSTVWVPTSRAARPPVAS